MYVSEPRALKITQTLIVGIKPKHVAYHLHYFNRGTNSEHTFILWMKIKNEAYPYNLSEPRAYKKTQAFIQGIKIKIVHDHLIFWNREPPGQHKHSS